MFHFAMEYIMANLIPYLGGKTKLAPEIIKHLPKTKTYCEVFAGAGNVFFRKEPSRVECLNDINAELTNLYRVVKNHLVPFVEEFRNVLVSRAEFQRQKDTPPETLTDIQRAARYFYLVKCSFGGRITSLSFGYAPSSPPRFNLLRIEEDLTQIHLRLARACVENLPYADFMQRWDREYVMFYLDPPYWDCETDYGKNLFDKSDFETLADLMRKSKGKCAMSINDVEPIRKIYSDFRMVELKTDYTVSKGKKVSARELLIMNY
jgi:DNA adenine methylase